MQDEDIDEALVREREAELRNINADVHKVNEIFRDLATLVDKQQDDVDKIGDLVERSHAHAEKGLDQVQKGFPQTLAMVALHGHSQIGQMFVAKMI